MLHLLPFVVGSFAFGFQADAVDSTQTVKGTIDSVILYPGQGLVERQEKLQLEAGVHEVVFTNLMEVSADELRASASEGWSVLSVQSEEVQSQGDGEGRIDELKKRVDDLVDQERALNLQHEGLEQDLQFINLIGVRSSSNATQDAGTSSLDLETLTKQLDYVQTKRKAIFEKILQLEKMIRDNRKELSNARKELEAYGATVDVSMTVKVKVSVKEAGAGEVRLAYVVYNVDWVPAYSVRLLKGNTKAAVDYDGIISQATGEDWSNVQLTLSTATPSEPSGPGEISPVFVNLQKKEKRPAADSYVRNSEAQLYGAEEDRYVNVRSGGTAVSYVFPDRVTVKTDELSFQRLRLASFDAPVSLVHVTRPVVEEKVYLRSDLENVSPYVLLPGIVSLFMEGDYIGDTDMASEVGVGGIFELWWGSDPSIAVQRIMLERETSRTGLLGGGRRTILDYRIDLENTASTPLMLEVWDRQPVSQSGDIEVRLADVNPAIATNPGYVETEKKLGLLKWIVTLGPAGKANAKAAISWSVRVSYSSDDEITQIPD